VQGLQGRWRLRHRGLRLLLAGGSLFPPPLFPSLGSSGGGFGGNPQIGGEQGGGWGLESYRWPARVWPEMDGGRRFGRCGAHPRVRALQQVAAMGGLGAAPRGLLSARVGVGVGREGEKE
jgi:hypothetical protein